MLFGKHVSIAGGIINAPARAAAENCEVFQMFSRSPQGGKVPEITDENVKVFWEDMHKYNLKEVYIHAPYFINLASPNPRTYHASISILKQELERGSKIGAKYMMFHPGSATQLGSKEEGRDKVVAAINEVLKEYEGGTMFLIENSAGAGNVMGDTFEEVNYFIEKSDYAEKIGVCLDTQHAFASGYNLMSELEVNQTLDAFDKHIGLEKLKMLHLNDSKIELGGKKDRHEHLGQGYIGIDGIKSLVSQSRLQNLGMIIETLPQGEEVQETDIQIVKRFRG